MAITFDTTSNGGSSNALTGGTYTFSHTTSGSNRILFVGVGSSGSTDFVTGVTYGGVSMSLVNKQLVTGFSFQYLFVLVNPALGANNIVVSASGGTVTPCGVSYTGAKQSAQPDNSTTNLLTSVTSITTTLTTVANNCWTIMFLTSTQSPCSAGAGTTFRVFPSASNIGMADSNGAITPAGSTSLISTHTNPGNDGTIMASFAPALVTTNGNFLEFM